MEPDFAHALALHQQGELDAAAQAYESILLRAPRHCGALHLLGVVAYQQRQWPRALALLTQAIAVDPRSAAAHDHLGLVLQDSGRPDEALAAYDRALAIEPTKASAVNNRGTLLLALQRHAEAASAFALAIRLEPADATAWVNHCAALRGLRQFGDALASADHALVLATALPEGWLNRGNVLSDMNRHADALASYDQALGLRPDYPEALNGKASSLRILKQHSAAAACFARLVEVAPGYRYALGSLQFARLNACDWSLHGQTVQQIETAALRGEPVAVPFALLAMADSPATHLQCARAFAASQPMPDRAFWQGGAYRHDRLRVAYLSADFHEHATAYLMAGLFEQHDRARFEVMGLSLGPEDASPMRQRLARAFDRFIDARALDDRTIAQMLRDEEIDIAVDLKGYTQDGRPGILAWRPAPVQVNYLGYPGTMGAPWMDYLIGDHHVLPPGADLHYTEQLVRLPHSYQPNDARRAIDAATPSRAQAGLPEQGFVFCCFNNNFKITPSVFGVWMRLLAAVPGSVLWLLHDNADAAANLRQAAQGLGLDPSRLVFAPRLALPQHLARHRLADLFLDTAPYGAHTGASDALWAGLPVLTCAGISFPSRVAAGLLREVGLPQLVTQSLPAYEAAAVRLATSGLGELRVLREALTSGRDRHPLFDGSQLRRGLETAFETMAARVSAGLAPEAFDVKD